jgi:signal peptidase II
MGNLLFALLAVVLITGDQISKVWINSHLYVGQVLWQYGFIQIVFVQNTGAAFGLFQDSQLPLIIIRSIGALIVLTIVVFYNRQIQKWGGAWIMAALGLIFTGTVGNLIDCFRLGYVVDFVNLTYWPVFNVADSCVVVAVFIIAILFIIRMVEDNKKPDTGGENLPS